MATGGLPHAGEAMSCEGGGGGGANIAGIAAALGAATGGGDLDE